MALTNAQRQARYRAERKPGSAKGEKLSTYLSADASTKLYGLTKGYGVTKIEILENLISAEYEKAVGSMEPNSPEWNEFFAE